MHSGIRKYFPKLRRLHNVLRWSARERVTHYRAWLKRRTLRGVTFIGITGSAGKTTAKDLAAAILERLGPCHRNPITANEHYYVDRTVATTTHEHRFCIVEASATKLGYLDRSVQSIRPRIAAVTLIAREHYSAFGSLEAIAAEKGKLVAALPPDGIAVLNIDDPLVRAIGERHRGRILWVGKDQAADLRLIDCQSNWPDPLVLSIAWEGSTVELRTRLHGTHLALPVLTAIGIGLAAGATLDQAVAAVAEAEPPEARMQIEVCNDGVVFVRDDWKAAQWSLKAPLEFMRTARAPRKVVVLGTISDSAKSPTQRYAHAARDALKAADLVLLVGTQALKGAKSSATGGSGENVKAFASVRDAALFLRDELRAGDLVLLKGTGPHDHLVRLMFDRNQPVQCWLPSCGMPYNCDQCPRLYRPPKVQAGAHDLPGEAAVRMPADDSPLIAGLGNAAARLFDTPHNVGYRVVDGLARSAGASWQRVPEGVIATAGIAGVPTTLFKPGANINVSGTQMQAFLERTGRSLHNCIVVYDDMDLELGTCRERRGGSDGGHKGIKSIIATFGTDDFQRVRIGVRRPGETRRAKELVLQKLTSADEAALAAGLEQAETAIRSRIASLHEASHA